MKKNRWLLRLVTLVVISCGLMTAAMAAEVGSSGDPLVTLSYLNEIFLEEVLDRVDDKIDERNRDIAKELGSQTGGSRRGQGSTDGGPSLFGHTIAPLQKILLVCIVSRIG